MKRTSHHFALPRTVLAGVLFAALVLVAGCRGDGDPGDGDLRDEPVIERVRGGGGAGAAAGDDASTMDEAMRSSKLKSLPPAVRLAANRDLAGTSITNVRAQPSEAGVLYRVTYIKDGTPKSTLYNDSGETLSVPGTTTRESPEAAATTATRP